MKFDKDFLIEKSVSTDGLRFALTTIELVKEKDDAFLIATDGRQLAKVPVELEEGDTLGKVSIEAIKAARKAAPRTSFDAHLSLNGVQQIPNGVTIPRPNEETNGHFPNHQIIIEKNQKAEVKLSVSLDAKRLLELAKSLGSEDVTLELVGGDEAIRVTGKPGTLGLLMPVKR